jgi:hypothetical protein
MTTGYLIIPSTFTAAEVTTHLVVEPTPARPAPSSTRSLGSEWKCSARGPEGYMTPMNYGMIWGFRSVSERARYQEVVL